MAEGPDELVVTVESKAKVVGCSRCGVRAEAQDRMPNDIRDLTCFGRPARLVWNKRRWRCIDADCDAKTWTEHSDVRKVEQTLDPTKGNSSMKIRVTSLLIVGALAFAGCGDDDPAAVDDPVSFGTLDANSDSYLDVDEIAESADDDRLFDAWDADADSELDPDEVAGNAFELWDADGNGRVSEKEWKDGTALWYPDDARLAVFSDWDGDGDSELDTDEISEHFDISTLGEAWRGSVTKSTFREAYFDLYDADDDGRVSESEWRTGSAVWGTPAE